MVEQGDILEAHRKAGLVDTPEACHMAGSADIPEAHRMVGLVDIPEACRRTVAVHMAQQEVCRSWAAHSLEMACQRAGSGRVVGTYLGS